MRTSKKKKMIASSTISNTVFNGKVDISHSDIVAIEEVHDLLIDAHGYSSNFKKLKDLREVILKLYTAFY